MSFTHTITTKWAGGSNSKEQAVANSADAEDNREITIASDATDFAVALPIDFSALASFYMLADQNLTIETNNATTPDDTISLIADEPLVWWDTAIHSCPFTVDVTNIYVTNGSGTATVLYVYVLQDSTP